MQVMHGVPPTLKGVTLGVWGAFHAPSFLIKSNPVPISAMLPDRG